jgi:hypothetical protein
MRQFTQSMFTQLPVGLPDSSPNVCSPNVVGDLRGSSPSVCSPNALVGLQESLPNDQSKEITMLSFVTFVY